MFDMSVKRVSNVPVFLHHDYLRVYTIYEDSLTDVLISFVKGYLNTVGFDTFSSYIDFMGFLSFSWNLLSNGFYTIKLFGIKIFLVQNDKRSSICVKRFANSDWLKIPAMSPDVIFFFFLIIR